jgi:hypothetical protein
MPQFIVTDDWGWSTRSATTTEARQRAEAHHGGPLYWEPAGRLEDGDARPWLAFSVPYLEGDGSILDEPLYRVEPCAPDNGHD